MPVISDQQLLTWTNIGAQASAEKTYASVQKAFEQYQPLKNRSYKIYLQGSYRNSTNIYGDCDVDIVVEYTDAFYPELSRLNDNEKKLYREIFPTNAPYGFADFRADVEKCLQAYYGTSDIVLRNKCILVKGKSGRLDADVVPCLTLRQFRSFSKGNTNDFWPGIQFITRKEGRPVINYPKVHYDNGAAKNQRVGGTYKPTVRLFKNLRNSLESERRIAQSSAPSYFVECLLSNVPDDAFVGDSLRLRFLNVVLSLAKADITKFTSQSGLTWLFGSSPGQWKLDSAQAFIRACLDVAAKELIGV
jgi:hypothetical protein